MKYPSNAFLFVMLSLVMYIQSAPTFRRSRAAALTEEESTTTSEIIQEEPQEKSKEESTTTLPTKTHNRKNKALNLFGYYPSYLSSGLDYNDDDDDDIAFGISDDHLDDDELSRTIPSRRQQQNKKKNGNGKNNFENDQINSLQYDNSPMFFIRLPPTPYMFVPGLGYISQPPNIGPPMSQQIPQALPAQVSDPFINLPIDFVSNGKPIGIYQWNGASGYPQSPPPQVPQMSPFGYGPQPLMPSVPRPSYNVPSYSKPKPKPAPTNSKVTNLKGQYLFNGKPGDSVYVLRDTYNSIYSDALQNFYP